MSLVGKVLSKINRIGYETSFKVNTDELNKIILINRETHNNISCWVENSVLDNSVFQYGIPDYLKHLINVKINNEPTYTDYIAYYSRFLNKPVSYFELGVSVGKNFYQLLNYFEDSTLTGFDIEEINPILSEKLSFDNVREWKGLKSELKANNSSLKEFNYKSCKVNYLSADIWDSISWAKLEGNKFNIIFSDALHDPKALLFEYEMLKKYNLLAEEFLIFWDDLVQGMRESFFQIAADLKEQYNLPRNNIHLIKVNGWLGQHEAKHDVGLITNIKIK